MYVARTQVDPKLREFFVKNYKTPSRFDIQTTKYFRKEVFGKKKNYSLKFCRKNDKVPHISDSILACKFLWKKKLWNSKFFLLVCKHIYFS